MTLKKRYIYAQPGGNFRDATVLELSQARLLGDLREDLIRQKREINEQINDLEKNCRHEVCYDEPGFPFVIRICVQCGWTTFIQ